MFEARIRVTLKPTVNDPQGLTIAQALARLGFDSVQSVRAGKFIEIKVDETDRGAAESQVQAMCERLLANPVIQTVRVETREAWLAAPPDLAVPHVHERSGVPEVRHVALDGGDDDLLRISREGLLALLNRLPHPHICEVTVHLRREKA